MATFGNLGVGEELSLVLVYIDVVGIIAQARDERARVSGHFYSHLAVVYECLALL
jgi:hypothetical protein